MQKTINEYPQSTGTKQEVLKWWHEYTRNLSTAAAVEAIYYRGNAYAENSIEPYEGYTATEVDSNGGYEDGGSYMDKTYMIHKESNKQNVLGYITVVGTYSSWDASEWDGPVTVVNPVEVTKVEFQQMKNQTVVYNHINADLNFPLYYYRQYLCDPIPVWACNIQLELMLDNYLYGEF